MSKKKKEAAVAVLSKAEVNNNINLTLNSNDVVDLLVEETREKLVSRYKELRDILLHRSFRGLNTEPIKKLVAHEYRNNPFIQSGLKNYKDFSLRFDKMNSYRPETTIPAYSDEQLDSDEFLKRDVYSRTTIEGPYKVTTDPTALLRIDFDDDANRNGSGAAIFVRCTEEFAQRMNEESMKVNDEVLALFNELQEVHKSLRSLSTKRVKARFVRNVLGNSPEGKEILSTISSISVTPKLLM